MGNLREVLKKDALRDLVGGPRKPSGGLHPPPHHQQPSTVSWEQQAPRELFCEVAGRHIECFHLWHIIILLRHLSPPPLTQCLLIPYWDLV